MSSRRRADGPDPEPGVVGVAAEAPVGLGCDWSDCCPWSWLWPCNSLVEPLCPSPKAGRGAPLAPALAWRYPSTSVLSVLPPVLRVLPPWLEELPPPEAPDAALCRSLSRKKLSSGNSARAAFTSSSMARASTSRPKASNEKESPKPPLLLLLLLLLVTAVAVAVWLGKPTVCLPLGGMGLIGGRPLAPLWYLWCSLVLWCSG
mmetsp:Transcript_21452/g.62752  ORF Transcript_21452/g.62752 Transcript_21452/m.62752 type:complete len:203 (+) Transcript_21452:3460-4068(+)